MELDAAFEAFVGDLTVPMFIVTTRVEGEPLGCLIGFTTQTSIHPPRFAICLSHANRTYRRGRDAELIAVHKVPARRHALAALFGGETTDDVDKFARCAWHEGPGGVPLLDECPSRLVGRVLWRTGAGDHDVFLLEPVAVDAVPGGSQLTLDRALDIEPGHPS